MAGRRGAETERGVWMQVAVRVGGRGTAGGGDGGGAKTGLEADSTSFMRTFSRSGRILKLWPLCRVTRMKRTLPSHRRCEKTCTFDVDHPVALSGLFLSLLSSSPFPLFLRASCFCCNSSLPLSTAHTACRHERSNSSKETRICARCSFSFLFRAGHLLPLVFQPVSLTTRGDVPFSSRLSLTEQSVIKS